MMADIVIPPRTDFQHWLARRLHKCVGYPNRAMACPLANWLKSHNGPVAVLSFGEPRVLRRKRRQQVGEYKPLPQWCADFIDVFDSVEPGATDGACALAVLSEVGESE